MNKDTLGNFKCPKCGENKKFSDGVLVELVSPHVRELILLGFPNLKMTDYVCRSCINQLNADYVQASLTAEKGELSELENEVIKSLRDHELFAHNPDDEIETTTTAGEKIADKVASFGGSWRFIITFGVILTVWITVNSLALMTKPFDPYPYILLNLILSCLAALQAPVIMMSQNRQEAKDRRRSEHDYQINLKAEIEIRHISLKIDHLLHHQWARLQEIQQIQLDLVKELSERKGR